VVATIIKEVRRHTDASYADIAWMMGTYPELYKDPSWLAEHKELGVSAHALAAAKHFSLPEMVELQRMAPVSPLTTWAIGTNVQQRMSSSASFDRRDDLITNWINTLETSFSANLGKPPQPFVTEEGGTPIYEVGDETILAPDEVYLMMLDIHRSGSIEFRALLESVMEDPNNRLQRIFQWKRAGWNNQEILDEIKYVQMQDPEAYLGDPPLELPEPGLEEANAEISKNFGTGIHYKEGTFEFVERYAAEDNWWQNIEVEEPEFSMGL
jgi:hypothetical protein